MELPHWKQHQSAARTNGQPDNHWLASLLSPKAFVQGCTAPDSRAEFTPRAGGRVRSLVANFGLKLARLSSSPMVPNFKPTVGRDLPTRDFGSDSNSIWVDPWVKGVRHLTSTEIVAPCIGPVWLV